MNAEQVVAIDAWKLAHDGAQKAAGEWRIAYESERERADKAQDRVDEYERVRFGNKRKALVIFGAAAVILLIGVS